MNTKLGVVFLGALLSGRAFADAVEAQPCTDVELRLQSEKIAERCVGRTTRYIFNSQNQALGYFCWDQSGEKAEAGMCNDFPEDGDAGVVANTWFYWSNRDGRNANPTTWKARRRYTISQDEGTLSFTVLNSSQRGNPTLRIQIEGTEGVAVDGQIVTLGDAPAAPAQDSTERRGRRRRVSLAPTEDVVQPPENEQLRPSAEQDQEQEPQQRQNRQVGSQNREVEQSLQNQRQASAGGDSPLAQQGAQPGQRQPQQPQADAERPAPNPSQVQRSSVRRRRVTPDQN